MTGHQPRKCRGGRFQLPEAPREVRHVLESLVTRCSDCGRRSARKTALPRNLYRYVSAGRIAGGTRSQNFSRALSTRRRSSSGIGSLTRLLVGPTSRDASCSPGRRFSLRGDLFEYGVLGYPAQTILSSILQNQGYRVRKALQCFFLRLTLSVRPWYFRRVSDVPIVVSLDHRGELCAQVYAPVDYSVVWPGGSRLSKHCG